MRSTSRISSLTGSSSEFLRRSLYRLSIWMNSPASPCTGSRSSSEFLRKSLCRVSLCPIRRNSPAGPCTGCRCARSVRITPVLVQEVIVARCLAGSHTAAIDRWDKSLRQSRVLLEYSGTGSGESKNSTDESEPHLLHNVSLENPFVANNNGEINGEVGNGTGPAPSGPGRLLQPRSSKFSNFPQKNALG